MRIFARMVTGVSQPSGSNTCEDKDVSVNKVTSGLNGVSEVIAGQVLVKFKC